MIKLFFSGHRQIASGMKKSIDILTGDSSKLVVFDAYVNEENVHDALHQFLDQTTSEDIKILISDMVGGSVNQILYPYAAKSNTFLIAGVNLALLLELVAAADREDITKTEIQDFIEQAKMSIQLIEINENEQTDNEFF